MKMENLTINDDVLVNAGHLRDFFIDTDGDGCGDLSELIIHGEVEHHGTVLRLLEQVITLSARVPECDRPKDVRPDLIMRTLARRLDAARELAVFVRPTRAASNEVSVPAQSKEELANRSGSGVWCAKPDTEHATKLIDLREPLKNARICLNLLLAKASTELAEVPSTSVKIGNELPESGVVGVLCAGEVLFRVLNYLTQSESEATNIERYIDELLKPAASSPTIQKQSEPDVSQLPTAKQVHPNTCTTTLDLMLIHLGEIERFMVRALKATGLDDLEIGHNIIISHEITSALALLNEAEELVKLTQKGVVRLPNVTSEVAEKQPWLYVADASDPFESQDIDLSGNDGTEVARADESSRKSERGAA